MTTDLSRILEQIDGLLATSPKGRKLGLETIEHTLTDGYAHALRLEAERWRLERELGAAAGRLDDADPEQARDLKLLGHRLSTASAELSELRERLSALREHAAAIRAAA